MMATPIQQALNWCWFVFFCSKICQEQNVQACVESFQSRWCLSTYLVVRVCYKLKHSIWYQFESLRVWCAMWTMSQFCFWIIKMYALFSYMLFYHCANSYCRYCAGCVTFTSRTDAYKFSFCLQPLNMEDCQIYSIMPVQTKTLHVYYLANHFWFWLMHAYAYLWLI